MTQRSLVIGSLLACIALAAPGGTQTTTLPGTGASAPLWSSITMFHGLPSPNVRAITQDRDGILWFGTDGGLVRYDGRRVDRVALGSASNSVRALAVDNQGQLWVGTAAGAWLRRGQGLVVPQTKDHAINAILATADGLVRLASDQGTVFTCTPGADGSVDVVSLGPAQAPLLRRSDGALPLSSIARVESTLRVGTRGRGLLEVRGSSVEQPEDPSRPFYVTSVATDGRGGTLLGAETSALGRGVFTQEGAKARPLDVRTGPVTSLALDSSSDLWAGTRERGVFRVRDGRLVEQLTAENSGGGLNSDHVLAVFPDRDGVIWVGTDRGVCRYDPHAARQYRLGPAPESNYVHALWPTRDGRLWIGTQRGLFVREAQGDAIAPVEQLGRKSVHALREASDGRLLVGTEGGLYVKEPADASASEGWHVATQAEQTPAFGQSVRTIQDLAGVLYLATYGQGLERLDGAERRCVWPEPADDPAWREVVGLSLVDGALWIATARAGVFVLRDGHATRNDELSGLGTLWCTASDGRGGHWIGTARGLLHLADGHVAPVVDGADVRALVPDLGPGVRVWCATMSGLLKVALLADGTILKSRLGTDYGLPSDSVFALATAASAPRQCLALGTNRGLALYEPGDVPPGLRLVRVLGQRPYAPEEWSSLHLDYPQNSLLVEAAAVSARTYAEHFQYLFSLSTATGRPLRHALTRDGQFAAESLPPGRYRVEVRAVGTDLLPSAPVSLGFDISSAPVPWASIFLAALLAAALLALAWGYRQNRRLVQANAALSETRLQLVQETENERRRIARDLHDQTLADLRRVLLMSSEHADSQKFREAVEAISTEVRRICEDLSPSVLQNVGLTAALEWALEESLHHVAPGRACRGVFVCANDVEERLSLAPAVAIQVYRIVQEALTNAARHASPSELRLTVRLEGPDLDITVEDDGPGFVLNADHKGRGLANIRSRASLISGGAEWRPRPSGGTVFRLRKAGAAKIPASLDVPTPTGTK